MHGDSDWASDEERKRSTSRLTEIIGSQTLDAASATQSVVALSSAKVEFYACNCGIAGGLHTCHFLTEAGYEVSPRVWSDSSACLWIVRRTGTGRLKHLEIRHMWKQEWRQTGEFLQRAVSTGDNVADLLTKHLAAARVEELLPKLGVRCLITRVEADHFDARADHVATVRIEHEVMLLVVECVVVVLALVVLAAAGPYCWWR